MKNAIISLLIILISFQTIRCDIPVHCLKHQIVGEWQFEITKPKYFDNLRDNHCGHSSPDDPDTSYLSYVDQFSPYETFTVTLQSNDVVISNDGDGTWTMIYDEGFEIDLNGEKFLSFFHYEPSQDGSGIISNCGQTGVGWYNNLRTGEASCFRATKILGPGESQADLTVIDDNIPAIQPIFLEQRGSQLKHLKAHVLGTHEILDLQEDFTDHHKIAHRLNTLAKKSWNADVHYLFHGKTIKELNQMAGRKSLKKSSDRHIKEMNNVYPDNHPVDVSDLPTQFKWSDDVVGPVRNQKSCGSCYVFATTNMIASRLKIKYDEDVLLSVQHSLDCNYYNQGCDGGYPFLVEKFATQFEMVPETCHPYKGKNGHCSSSCDVNSLDKVYRAKSYGFVGGAYGRSNERNIMVELMNNGPMAASFEPDYTFMYYNGGVYHHVPAADWILNGEQKPEWEKVDHSVLLHGWGEENGEKYWILKNTWGDDWGENGHFRMRRGTDESSVESMAEVADPYIVYKCDSPHRLGAADETDECY